MSINLIGNAKIGLLVARALQETRSLNSGHSMLVVLTKEAYRYVIDLCGDTWTQTTYHRESYTNQTLGLSTRKELSNRRIQTTFVHVARLALLGNYPKCFNHWTLMEDVSGILRCGNTLEAARWNPTLDKILCTKRSITGRVVTSLRKGTSKRGHFVLPQKDSFGS